MDGSSVNPIVLTDSSIDSSDSDLEEPLVVRPVPGSPVKVVDSRRYRFVLDYFFT